MKNKKSKNLKHYISALLTAFLCLGVFISAVSCTSEEDGREKIVCTTFVLADWTRAVLGEDAQSFSIELLGANGADIHSYQPTVKDITLLSRCAVFVHIGGESDAWANDTLSSAANADMTRIDIAAAMQDELCEDGHEHSHEGHSHTEDEHHFDEHIWFSFSHAKGAVTEIARALGDRYPDKKELYEKNAASYTAEISALEAQYSQLAASASVKDVVVADRYPFSYLFDFMGICAHAAFEGCSAESEASFEVIAKLSGRIDECSLRYILVCEDSNKKIAEAVKNNAKQKGVEILTLNSLQSQGKRELDMGVGYLSVMRDNLDVISLAISK